MKCTNKPKRYLGKQIAVSLLITILLLCGCESRSYELPYDVKSENTSYRVVVLEESKGTAKPFAADICVINDNKMPESLTIDAAGAGLFNINGKEVLCAKNVHEKLYPASLTKIMTALVALKKSSTDTILTATANVKNLEAGAQTCGIKAGDQMTLAQALHLLLINSANDAAVMIAEGVAGSIEGFAELMNEQARELGATNTHFVNPHGLSDENHYTTVYDIYLILNEAIKYEMFNEIIQMDSYTTVYHDANGLEKEISVNSTNLFLTGDAKAPGGIKVLGGKTGTTNAAGHCLAIVSKDTANKPYISVILRADSRDSMYQQMSDLLSEINN